MTRSNFTLLGGRRRTIQRQFSHAERHAIFVKAFEWLWTNLWDKSKPFVTASELHRRVRASLQEQVDKVPYGKYGHNTGMTYIRVSGFGLSECRVWLYGQVQANVLRMDNERGRSATGMRFRPKDVEITEAEKATAAANKRRKEKGTIYHDPVIVNPTYHTKKPACQKDRKQGAMYRRPRTFFYTVTEAEKAERGYGTTVPTCSHCLRLRHKNLEKPA